MKVVILILQHITFSNLKSLPNTSYGALRTYGFEPLFDRQGPY